MYFNVILNSAYIFSNAHYRKSAKLHVFQFYVNILKCHYKKQKSTRNVKNCLAVKGFTQPVRTNFSLMT